MQIVTIKGMAHITGGGITDNLPRSLPAHLGARIQLGSWTVPPIFGFLRSCGGVEDLEMLRTFNMGMGFLLVVSQDEAERALRALSQAGSDGVVIGSVIEAEHRVHYAGRLGYGD